MEKHEQTFWPALITFPLSQRKSHNKNLKLACQNSCLLFINQLLTSQTTHLSLPCTFTQFPIACLVVLANLLDLDPSMKTCPFLPQTHAATATLQNQPGFLSPSRWMEVSILLPGHPEFWPNSSQGPQASRCVMNLWH